MVKYCSENIPNREFREDDNERNGSREKAQRKTKTKMGEIHWIYSVRWQQKAEWGRRASISQQRHLSSDVCSCKRTREHITKWSDRNRRDGRTVNLGQVGGYCTVWASGKYIMVNTA